MPQISVIVPVYNTAKYLEKCLNSILNQKMKDFEVIIVNDGSTDNSEEIINKFLKKYPYRIKSYKKKNGGLSDTRNFGIEKSTGEYLCFVDSDDYIDTDLFENIQKYIKQGIELIKFKCIKVNSDYEFIEKINGPVFETKSGQEAFNELYFQDILMEVAWLYLYKRSFFQKNNFTFPIKKYHEDWAIVPYIILNAKTVVSIDTYGYYYVQSSDSITRNNDDEKIYQRANDMLEHYDRLIKEIDVLKVNNITKQNFKIYMTNCIILKLEELPNKYHKQFIKEIKKRKLIKNIKCRNIKQFIKKILLKINIKLYLKMR